MVEPLARRLHGGARPLGARGKAVVRIPKHQFVVGMRRIVEDQADHDAVHLGGDIVQHLVRARPHDTRHDLVVDENLYADQLVDRVDTRRFLAEIADDDDLVAGIGDGERRLAHRLDRFHLGLGAGQGFLDLVLELPRFLDARFVDPVQDHEDRERRGRQDHNGRKERRQDDTLKSGYRSQHYH